MALKKKVANLFSSRKTKSLEASYFDSGWSIDYSNLVKGKSFLNKDTDPSYKVDFPWLFDREHKGSRWDFDPIELRQLSQGDIWIQMMIQSISKEIANCPWQIVENDDTEVFKDKNPFERAVDKSYEPKEVENDVADKINDLFSNPDPDYDFTEVLEIIVSDLLEVGNACLYKKFSPESYDDDYEELITDKPELDWLRPIDPVTFTKEFDPESGVVKKYHQFEGVTGGFMGIGKYVESNEVDKKELMWLDLNPRSNRRYGLPPTLPAKRIIELLDLTVQQETNFWEKGGFINGILKHSLDNKEVDLFKEEEDSNKGKPENRIPLLNDPDADFLKIGVNWSELKVTERLEYFSKIIASIYQVPVSVVGLKPEEVNRATFEGERGNFESNTLGAYLQKIERWFNKYVVWMHFGKNYRFEFKPGMSEKQKQSISGRVENQFTKGIITRNEARRELGWDEVEPDEDGFHEQLINDSEPDEPAMFNYPTGKPFGRWDSFEDCVDDMIEQGYDEETASKVCGALQERLKKKDKPLRETDEWYEFHVQPSEIEEFKEEISGEVKETFNNILEDTEFLELVAQMMNTTEKSSGKVSRLLRDLVQARVLGGGLKGIIVRNAVEQGLNVVTDISDKEDLPVEEDKVEERIRNRDFEFADDYAQRMESEVRDVLDRGLEEGKTVSEVQQDLRDKADEFSDYQAERIARTEMNRASAEAQREFAVQHADKYVLRWITSEDDRVRPGHKKMHGKWRRPSENWLVPYKAGEVEEAVQGDSKYGINCRCSEVMIPIDEVKDKNHAGV